MYTIAMGSLFNPKKQLQKLLGPTPKHPWAALIPQVLLWSFRRFCVEKLTLSEGGLEESLCDDVLELVHMYCAKGLEVVSMDWLTPENIEEVHSPLEAYMKFFIAFSKELDKSINDDDDKKQDALSEFLDESIGNCIIAWLDEKHYRFLIFPIDPEDDNEFTETQFSSLISALLMYSYSSAAENKDQPAPQPEPEPEPEVQPQPQPQPEPQPQPQPEPEVPPPPRRTSLLWYVLAAAKHAEEVRAALSIPPAPPTEEHIPEPPSKEPPVARAFARRRTLCIKGRRAQAPRVKTRKTHPASY
jgi:hypothetical protein